MKRFVLRFAVLLLALLLGTGCASTAPRGPAPPLIFQTGTPLSSPLATTVPAAGSGTQLLAYRYNYPVTALAWSPNSKSIASSAGVPHAGNTIQIQDAATGKVIVNYSGHTTPVNAIAWSPDGTRIASGDGYSDFPSTVQVWDTAAGRRLLTYQGHTGAVLSVAWSPDGTRIASGGQNGMLQIWQAPS